MLLTQTQFETLLVFVYRDAFDADSLYQQVRLKLGADMYKEWVGTGMPFKDTVMKLIDKLQEVRMIVPFLDMVLEVRAAKSGIEAIRAIRDSLNTATLSTSDQTAAITSGVEGMAGKMGLEPVHQMVMRSQGVLTELTAKIELLRAYKDLHDALHTAKLQFRSLEISAKQMASDPMAAGDFGQAVMCMETLVTSMTAIVQSLPDSPSSVRQDEADWLARFTSAITISRSAADAGDHVSARQGVQGIRSVLRTEPSRIDNRLSRTADEIDLARLKEVFASAAALHELAGEAAMLETGRTAAEQLLRQVKAQINQHAEWQALDRSLAGADDIMRTLTPDEPWDFDALWKGLKEGVNALVAVDEGSEWAKKITTIVGRVDASRTASDWAKLPVDFNRFRQEATVQFFVVDTKLKMLAGEVNVIGTPLRNLLNHL